MSSDKQLVVPRSWRAGKVERNIAICRLYETGRYTTQQIARRYYLTPRAVQKVVRSAGFSRTIAESNRVVAPLKCKHRIRRRS